MSMGPPWVIKYITPLYYTALRLSQKAGFNLRDVAFAMKRPTRVVASMIDKAGARLEELTKANAKGEQATLEDFNVPDHAAMKAAGLERMSDVEKMLIAGTLDDFLSNCSLQHRKRALIENLRIFQDMRASRR